METRMYTFLSLKNLSKFPIKLKWKVLITFKPPKSLEKTMVRMRITFIIASNIFMMISKQELSTSKQLKMNG
jgi:hypothetical protein